MILKDCHYGRVSTQIQESITLQLAGCRRVSERDGALVVAQLQDKESGLEETRDGYQEALRLLRTKQADRLVIWRLDRFGRDQVELLSRLRELARLGVPVVSATEGPLDEFLGGLLSILAQRESRTTSIRVHARLRDIVEREGRWLGKPYYGTRAVPGQPGRLAIHEQEAAMVRQLFTMYASGQWRIRSLIAWFNAQIDPATGRPRRTAHGSPYRGHWLKGLLQREAYTGEVVWNRRRASRLDGSGHHSPEEHVRVRADVPLEARGAPAIIEPELFARVQRELALQASHRTLRTGTNTPQTQFLLTSFLHCGLCLAAGSRATRMSGTWANEKRARVLGVPPHRFVYRCPRTYNDAACAMGGRSGAAVDDVVLGMLSSLRVRPESERRGVRTARQRQRESELEAEDAAHISRLRADIGRVEARLHQLGMDRLDGIFSPRQYQDLATHLEADLARLHAELELAVARQETPLHLALRAAEALGDLSGIRDLGVFEQRAILAQCLSAVILHEKYPLRLEVRWLPWLRTLVMHDLCTLPEPPSPS